MRLPDVINMLMLKLRLCCGFVDFWRFNDHFDSQVEYSVVEDSVEALCGILMSIVMLKLMLKCQAREGTRWICSSCHSNISLHVWENERHHRCHGPLLPPRRLALDLGTRSCHFISGSTASLFGLPIGAVCLRSTADS